MKKFLVGFFAMLTLISLIANGVLGYLFYNEYTKNNDLKDEIESLKSQLDAASQTLSTEEAKRTFIDEGMEVAIEYPSTWDVVVNVGMSKDFAYDETQNLYGPIGEKYEVTFETEGANLKFSKILGGVGGMTQALQSTKHNYKILEGFEFVYGSQNTKLGRYQEKNWDRWVYVPLDDCANLPTGETSDINICVGPFFPGFGVGNFASSATVETNSEELLAEADQIAISAVND